MEHILRGMDRIDMLACCVSTNLADSESTMKLASKSRRIFPFVGIHPEFADVEALPELAKLASSSPAGHRRGGPRSHVRYQHGRPTGRLCIAAWTLQRGWACPYPYTPARAWTWCLDILTSYSCRALLHWFDGRKADLRRAAPPTWGCTSPTAPPWQRTPLTSGACWR